MYPKEDLEVKIFLQNETVISGKVNIAGCERFSEFIENDTNSCLKLYDCNVKGQSHKFILVPRDKVLYYTVQG